MLRWMDDKTRKYRITKKIILLDIELRIELQYIQEIWRPYPDILKRKLIEKIMKYTKKEGMTNRKKIIEKHCL